MIKRLLVAIITTINFGYTGNILLKIKPNSDILAIVDTVNAKDFKNLGSNIYLLKFDSDKNLTKVSKSIQSNDNVVYAYPDKIRNIRKR